MSSMSQVTQLASGNEPVSQFRPDKTSSTASQQPDSAALSPIPSSGPSAISRLSPEVLSLVFSEIQKYPCNGKNLVNIATTRRAWAEPVLDILWRFLPSALIFIYTLPHDTWVLEKCVERHSSTTIFYRSIHFVRKLVYADFERTRMYVHRIKSVWPILGKCWDVYLHNDPLRLAEDCRDVFTDFAQFLRFPALRALQCGVASPAHTLEHQFIGAALSSLTIFIRPVYRPATTLPPNWNSCYVQMASRVLSRVVEMCPRIEHFAVLAERSLEYYRWVPYDTEWSHLEPLVRPLAAAIQAGSRLVTFQCPHVHLLPTALSHFGRLSTAKYLNIRVRQTDYLWDTLPHASRAALSFPNLETFHVRLDCLDWLVALFRVASFPSLLDVAVRTNELVDPLLLQTFLDCLAAQPCRLSIRELRLWVARDAPVPNAFHKYKPPLYFSDTFAPLFRLPSLQALSLKGHCHVLDLDPLATSKYYSIVTDGQYDVRAGLDGLIAFVSRCRHLEVFAVDIDYAEPYDEVAFNAALPVLRSEPAPPLDTLLVGRSRIGDAMLSVASVLSELFPSLRKICTPWFYETVAPEKSPQVDDVREEQARRHEQFRADATLQEQLWTKAEDTAELVDPQRLKTVFECLAELHCKLLFRALTISVADQYIWKECGISPGYKPTLYQPDKFTPLLSLPSVESLTIHGHCHVALDNPTFFRLARTWPNLRNFDLIHQFPMRKDATVVSDKEYAIRVGLDGIIGLAAGCRHLKGLRLAFNTHSYNKDAFRAALLALRADPAPPL
ncbi:hypothetical protein BD413DRAFT_615490 [Trametes elegans]|nr:hypothetical protein BD413DRAFT_615490 [Trametes elegans]